MKNKIQLHIIYKQYPKNKPKDMDQWKIKGQEKLNHADADQNRDGIFIIIVDKIDFETKRTSYGRGCPNTTTKVSTLQEYITILKLHINKISTQISLFLIGQKDL